MDSKKKTVGVVGAGPCGIFISYALSTISDSVYFQIYDKQEYPGGQWVFNPNKIDKYGMTVHSSVYDDLWLNGPKQALELPIYRFSQDLPSFCTRHDMTKYINGFIDHFKLRDKVQCSSLVQSVVYNEEEKKFILSKKNLQTNQTQIKEFDFVIVSTGHFSIPHDPKLPGQQTFTGEVFHSHFFRDSKLYKGKRILNIGGSYSSEDIALQCHKFGAQKVTIANKSKKFPFKWPSGIEQKPFTQIKSISGLNIQFTDGSSEEFDVIIKCTGYLHEFPFLDQSLRLKTANILNPPLYQQIVHPQNERLFYMGMQNQFYTMSMFYLQSMYIRAVISGRLKLPSLDQRLIWIEQDKVEAQKLKTAEDKILYQSKYIDGLAEASGQKSLNAANLFLQWVQYKRENIMTYRDKQFKSIYTSQLAPKGSVWADAGDVTIPQ